MAQIEIKAFQRSLANRNHILVTCNAGTGCDEYIEYGNICLQGLLVEPGDLCGAI